MGQLQLCPALQLHPLHLAVRYIVKKQVLTTQTDKIDLLLVGLLQGGDARERCVELWDLYDL